MKSEKIILQNSEITLVFDSVELPYQDQDLHKTKIVCYFNFKEPTYLIIGEIIKEGEHIKLFETEDEAREYAKDYINRKYNTHM
jgi:hypothetical protein